MNLELVRERMAASFTRGRLWFGSEYVYTLELPWRDNRPDVSCIPAGTYDVVPYDSIRLGKVYHLTGVPDRSGILIHPGNVEADTEGCILVGLSAGYDVHGNPAIYNADVAMDRLRTALGRITINTIKVINP